MLLLPTLLFFFFEPIQLNRALPLHSQTAIEIRLTAPTKFLIFCERIRTYMGRHQRPTKNSDFWNPDPTRITRTLSEYYNTL